MKILVTGGAGFIGRWVVKSLLEKECNVYVIDNLSLGKKENLQEFQDNPYLKDIVIGDIRDKQLLSKLFKSNFDACIHMASSVVIQRSIDNPAGTFSVDLEGTFNILEEARRTNTKIIFVSTGMVYDAASCSTKISEDHATKPSSPYSGAKLAAENLVMAYHFTYGLPVVILRPFNTYGPFQEPYGHLKGVVSIFIQRNLQGKILNVYGDGNQTRDLLYVTDCADFIVRAALSDKVNGEIINAGFGEDISINDLALMIAKDPKRIRHVKHHHPQSEIPKLVCDYSKAKKLLDWEPAISLAEGIRRTEIWIKERLL